MQINTTKHDSCLDVALTGRLDTQTSVELEEALKNALTEDVKELVFDFEKLDYISSAGLRVVLSTHKKMSKLGGMKVVHVNETVMEVFDMTGFCDILTIE